MKKVILTEVLKEVKVQIISKSTEVIEIMKQIGLTGPNSDLNSGLRGHWRLNTK